MRKTAIVTDSNSGMTAAAASEHGIEVIPMPFTVDGETYYENVNLSREDFFLMLAEGRDVKTSQPLPEDIFKVWDRMLKDYEEIVHIPMSSGLSGACQSAMLLAEEFDGRVHVVNNRRISVTQLSSAMDAAALADLGLSGADIKDALEKAAADSSIYIMLETLEYLKKGGRITPAAAAVGTVLRIKPVLMIRGDKLDAFSKARTVSHGRQTMISAMKNDLDSQFGGSTTETADLYAVEGQCPEKLDEFYAEVCEAFPAFRVKKDSLPLSICCHIGPEALAIACSGKMNYEETANQYI